MLLCNCLILSLFVFCGKRNKELAPWSVHMDPFKRCKMRGTSQVSERGLVSDWLEEHKRLLDWFKM